MVDRKTSEAAQKVSQYWSEAGQAVVQTVFDVQDRSLQYVQNSFTDGVETLKSNIDASQQLFHMENKPPNQQEPIPALIENRAEVYKRTIAFAQRTTERGTETFRANASALRDLTQMLMKRAQERQHLFFW